MSQDEPTITANRSTLEIFTEVLLFEKVFIGLVLNNKESLSDKLFLLAKNGK